MNLSGLRSSKHPECALSACLWDSVNAQSDSQCAIQFGELIPGQRTKELRQVSFREASQVVAHNPTFVFHPIVYSNGERTRRSSSWTQSAPDDSPRRKYDAASGRLLACDCGKYLLASLPLRPTSRPAPGRRAHLAHRDLVFLHGD